ncbi:MAG: DUF3793 family protein [Lachnospiraceae bacterium]|nr:DUF3793 family protein [Lachnospiraceae bacterium]
MLLKTLVEYCAPTLAGLKTGNIFTIKNGLYDIDEEICSLNTILVERGLRLVPLRKKKESIMIYLYRPERLKEDLKDPAAVKILKDKGYHFRDPDCCIAELARHLKSDPVFPHEIGLFLGYPPYDVKKFMEDPFRGVKCVGCWKAYGDECEAKKTFDKYKKCTAIYSKQIECGRPLEALIVNPRRQVRLCS